jgi:hypothetical protein
VAILGLLFLSSLLGQTQLTRVRIPITVSDSGAITKTFKLYLGLHPGATICRDTAQFTGFALCGIADTAHVTEVEAPPDPPSAVFRFSPFNSAECNINFWKDDIRRYVDSTQNDTFKVLLKTEPDFIDTHAVTYTWPACIGQIADSAILQQRIGGTAPGAYKINMAQQTSFTLHVSTGGIGSSLTVNSHVILKGPRADQIVAVDDASPAVPAGFALAQNYPNPFNPSTRISYTVARTGRVTLEIFNLLGQPVARLVDADQAPGEKSVTWDAAAVPAGIYLYRLSSASGVMVRKMVLLR